MKSLKIYSGLSVLTLLFICANSRSYVQEVFHWKKIEYDNLPKPDNTWIGPYKYHIPENNDLVSIGYHPASGLMVVNIFRCRPGVPITVGAFCVQDYKSGSSPRIWGFPNYELNALYASDFTKGSDEEQTQRRYSKENYMKRSGKGNYYSNYHDHIYRKPSHEKGNTFRDPVGFKRIISALHTVIDEKCNRLFLVDNGILQFYHNTTYSIQKPALVEIALPSNACESRKTRNFPITRRSEIPDRISSKGSNGYMYTTMDYQSQESCEDLFMYITNPFYAFLVVYDYKKDIFWAIDHETFKPVIAESHFIFDKTYNLDMPLGMMSIALGYADKNGDRTAYYIPFASTAQYEVSTKILKNSTVSDSEHFKIMGHRGCGHEANKMVIDYTYGVIFYEEIQSNAITCWNIRKPLNPDNLGLVYKSDKNFFYSQMFIDSKGYLWFHSSHVPIEFLTDLPLNLQQVNSRTFRVRVADAIRGTVCENSDHFV